MEYSECSLFGFSTGALALGNFRLAIEYLSGTCSRATELSALRSKELLPLMSSLPELDLSSLGEVSVHAPSRFGALGEEVVANVLRPCIEKGIRVIVHPHALERPSIWQEFGDLLCIENNDLRKPGRTVEELCPIFERFGFASWCFDVAHAWSVDHTLGEAKRLIDAFGERMSEVHISQLDDKGAHFPLTERTIALYRQLDLPRSATVIIESPVPACAIEEEIEKARTALRC